MKPIFYICILSLFALVYPHAGKAQTYNLDWGSSFSTPWADGALTGTAYDVAPGVDVKVTIFNNEPSSWRDVITSGTSGSTMPPAVSPTNSRSGFFYMPSSYTSSLLELDVDWSDKSKYLTVTYEFSQPVYNISLYIGDIDKYSSRNPSYIDFVSFAATNAGLSSGNAVITVMDPQTPAWLTTGFNQVSATTTNGNGGNSGTRGNSDQEGTIRLQYNNAVDKLVVTYKNPPLVTSYSNPSLQAIAISNLRFNVPLISGTVWHDANNSANNTFTNIFTSGEPGTNAGGQLYVNLVNVLGNVISSVPVSSNGTYFMAMPRSTAGLRLQLSNVQGVVGNAMPASAMPTGWVATSPQVTSPFTSGTTDITGRDFGVNQLPETAVKLQSSVTNPGGYNFYTIPTSAFQGTGGSQTYDYSPGYIPQIRITSFPTNANYIQIGSTIYSNGGPCAPSTTCTAWPSGGVTLTYNNGTGPAPAIAIDPIDGNVTSVISFVAIDNAGDEDATPGSVSQPFTVPLISISGYLYDDANGSLFKESGEPKISGTVGTSGGSITTLTSLYVILSNASNMVIASQQLGADGNFTISGAPGNTSNLSIRISTSNGVVGSTEPAINLPSGWAITGENLNGTVDAVEDGEIVLSTGTSNITNYLFGWERIPVADAKSYTIATPPANSYITLNGSGTQPGALSGTDAEDGSLGAGEKVAITALPSNGNQLYYNGVQITKGADGINAPSVTNPFIISAYNAALLQVRLTGLGSTGVSFSYAWIDNAGQQGTAVSYSINWAFVLPVEITSFTARANGSSVMLDWSVDNQVKFDHYEIEYSTDNRSFGKAGEVKASTASSDNYQFTHYLKEAAAKIYYRLKLVDIDGNYRYSATVLVKFNSAATAIWPTLLHAGETLYVQPGTDLQLNASLQVMDGSGRIILHQKTNNQSVISLQTGQWNAGIYIVKLQSGTEQTINKIVIQP